MTEEDQQPGGASAKAEPKRGPGRRRELRVTFDTNVLFTGSASDLIRQEAATLIGQSRFPDLDIQWYLPEVVRLERQFQMQNRALELLAPLERVEKLLGHNLNITREILVDRVEKVIAQRQMELGLIALKPEYANLDWNRLVLDAAFRRAPFQEGKSEKGFRDALVVESFVHLVNISPKTPKVCRVVLVTGDNLVGEAVRTRLAGAANAAVLASLEDLRGFINTLVSEVDEAFLASLRSKAQRLFFAPNDESTLYYKERVRENLTKKFGAELEAQPAGATYRKNVAWRIHLPTFSKKNGQRIHWISRIEIETEATKLVRDELPTAASETAPSHPGWTHSFDLAGATVSSLPENWDLLPAGQFITAVGAAESMVAPAYAQSANIPWQYFGGRTVVTHKGTDAFDVLWSVDVTTANDLRRPSVDDLVHLAASWEGVQ